MATATDTTKITRKKLIEKLLADKQYGVHMADVWDHLLVPRNTPGCEPAVEPRQELARSESLRP